MRLNDGTSSVGTRNAQACLAGAVAGWYLIALGCSHVFKRPVDDFFQSAFLAVWSVAMTGFLLIWLKGRRHEGVLLLDCGPHPARWLFAVVAVIFAGLGIVGLSEESPVQALLGQSGSGLCLVFALYWAVMACGRLQVREQGIWLYWGLIRWDSIGAYRWLYEGPLLIRTRGCFSILGGAVMVPRAHRNAFNGWLNLHSPVLESRMAR